MDGQDLSAAALRERLALVAASLTGLPYRAWTFGDSVGFEGLVAASDALDDPQWLAFARGFIRSWAAARRDFVRLDCTAPGLAMVEVARRSDDPLVLERALQLADYLVARPRIGRLFATWEHSPLQHPYGPGVLPPDQVRLLADPPPGAFIDCLHFDPPFLVALGVHAGRDDLVREGVEQALAYVDVLQQDDGLFDHFILEGAPTTYGRAWGRGQGWALLGLLDVIEHLPADHADAAAIAAAAERLIVGMCRTQRADGHWDAVVGDAASGDETSTAAFMAAGFRRAVRLGVVSAEVAGPAAGRALAAAVASSPGGILADVSAAVNACTLDSHYAHVPRGFVVPWGQGPLALALVEALRDERSRPGAAHA
jgi:unsaturated rhamnogalacturonyl hydrolase